MRLWHQALIPKASPSATTWSASGMLRSSWQWLGQETCDRYALSLLALSLP